jgi:hypothetical protein
MELESLTQLQERRLSRLSDLETKLQTLQLQSRGELSKKDAAFKRDMDALRLQLVRYHQLENEVATLTEALKRSTEREKSFRKDFTKHVIFPTRGFEPKHQTVNISSQSCAGAG